MIIVRTDRKGKFAIFKIKRGYGFWAISNRVMSLVVALGSSAATRLSKEPVQEQYLSLKTGRPDLRE